ncbi:hypothetical protein HOV03_gp46 [Gordonia phage Asapag]|uniref:Uncharacterized protein n=2 Tax=Langleyhallvirinae TaxID=2732613 RepID=A0A385E1P0_9CAUD|nr:hypothetical protein HOT94_gp050 [Gordonia phage Phistory]YP_009819091.1 hypothetical protein HOV03_gp46 [Gordonia phage Asapag]AXQ64755.1 hypothetical protein SEA_PHISTORY_50 [Gordonia phage Phistory]QAU07240.1 hypothetical protein SEA_ASAPAG_46 [Gordonia phage Asapag]UTN91510.1 hypothetical protein SEA_PERIWINKLE_56 [Gordonia phage Periwinkle]
MPEFKVGDRVIVARGDRFGHRTEHIGDYGKVVNVIVPDDGKLSRDEWFNCWVTVKFQPCGHTSTFMAKSLEHLD